MTTASRHPKALRDTLPEILDRIGQRMASGNREASEDMRQRLALQAVSRAMHAAGVPRSILEAVEGPTIDTDARVRLRAAWESGARLAALCGLVGRGKSIAAANAMRVYLWQLTDQNGQLGGRHAAWVHVSDLAGLGRYGDGRETRQHLQRVGFLVIDDLGTEALDKAGFTAEIIDALIYHRHASQRPTIVTANMTAEDMRRRYGERVASRFADEHSAIIGCPGDDMRRAEHRPQTTATGGGNTQPSLSELYGSGRLTIDHLGDIE